MRRRAREFQSQRDNWIAGAASADSVRAVQLARDVLIYAMIAATALSGLQYLGRAALLLKAD